MTEIACVLDAKAQLGEGPCWDANAQCLWWVDIWGKAIHAFDPKTGADCLYQMPLMPGSLAVRAAGGLVVAMGNGFYLFDAQTNAVVEISAPEAGKRGLRFNDGGTDRQGRFWAGSVHEEVDENCRPIAALYRLDAVHRVSCHIKGIGISNGLAWSPDGRKMYHADSLTPYVWRWDYDPLSGDIENRQTFIDLSDIRAVADGATVDAEGCYWVALPFKGLVHRYDPQGKLIQAISLPIDMPTCCEFGGENLDTLYVTSAIFGRPRQQLETQPLVGGLFAIDVGVRGLGSTAFAG